MGITGRGHGGCAPRAVATCKIGACGDVIVAYMQRRRMVVARGARRQRGKRAGPGDVGAMQHTRPRSASERLTGPCCRPLPRGRCARARPSNVTHRLPLACPRGLWCARVWGSGAVAPESKPKPKRIEFATDLIAVGALPVSDGARNDQNCVRRARVTRPAPAKWEGLVGRARRCHAAGGAVRCGWCGAGWFARTTKNGPGPRPYSTSPICDCR